MRLAALRVSVARAVESPSSRLCHDRRVSAAASPGSHQAGARRHRLDDLLVERGLVEDRVRAGALIMAGKVRVGAGDGARIDHKPGELVRIDVSLAVDEPPTYVGRGGHKLAAALDAFGIDPGGRTCLDVGASTGGFTDVLLQRGASRVYALDVGRGQLAESLRTDARVVSMERTNARALTSTTLPDAVSLTVIDVSFISLGLILTPVASASGPDGGEIVALVKPQFEAARGQTVKGVVRDPGVRREVLQRVVAGAAVGGLQPRGVIASPLTGADGNREYLLWLHVPPGSARRTAAVVPAEVTAAVNRLTAP